mgnify:CR=1 FL=1
MKYYKLNRQGTKWDELSEQDTIVCKTLDLHSIKLYDDDLNYKGIGYYNKN